VAEVRSVSPDTVALRASSERIVAIEACTVRVPLDKVTSFATRVVSDRVYGLVRVRTSDGLEGIGFCYAGSRVGGLVATAIRDLFAPLLIGEDPWRVEAHWDRMYREALLHGRTGSVMRALSIIDVALWDRNARAVGKPLHKLLGGYARESVGAYASGGYYVDGKGPEALAEEVRGYVDQGFKAVKIKVGRFSPKDEEARVAAARAAIGPDVLLMLDANNAWSDLQSALQHTQRYEAYNPYWLEEPFGPDDIDNHARLAQRTPITIATGEIEAGRWRFKELLQKEAAGILQADAAVCGGVTEWRRIAATAASYGATVAPHWFHDLHVHLVAATPNATWVEYFTDDQVLNFWRLVDHQLSVEGGQLRLPAGPGLGFLFDEAAIARYREDEGS
jgi:L-alanine-DL-glutamate epimerase-like enolase superfamily enzyme